MRHNGDLATHCVPFSFAAPLLQSMSFIPAAALGIFAGTLLLVVTRPKNLAIGWSALIGAAACGAFSMLQWSDVVGIWPKIGRASLGKECVSTCRFRGSPLH